MTEVRQLAARMRRLAEGGRPVLVAIDGRCASGKTTLAALLQAETGCNLLHMDDFFLRPEQRTPQRIRTPGGNVDYERFLSEVLLPLSRGVPFAYRPYDCKTQALAATVPVEPKPFAVVEGAYSCHPVLRNYYNLRVFLDVDAGLQRQRILARNGKERLPEFTNRWIPLEERYIAALGVRECCQLSFQADGAAGR